MVQPSDWSDAGPAFEAELLEWLRPRIGRPKIPRKIDFAEVLPRTPTGKLLKRELREAYWR